MWARSRTWIVVCSVAVELGAKIESAAELHRAPESEAGEGMAGFTAVVCVTEEEALADGAAVDPCAGWCAAESICACFCPYWEAAWDCAFRLTSDCDALPALPDGDEESGGEGKREAPLRSVAPADGSQSFSPCAEYLDGDFARVEDGWRGVASRE